MGVRGFRFAAALTVLALGGCVGRIDSVDWDSVPPTCSFNTNECGVRPGARVEFPIFGRGKCDALQLSLGDGQVLTERNVDFDSSRGTIRASGTYPVNGWRGRKTLRAEPVLNCGGGATARIVVFGPPRPTNSWPLDHIVGMAPTATACTAPSAPPLRARATISTVAADSQTINFGCPFGGCVYGPDGRSGANASGAFPFPGLRPYSLVLRVGGQVIQGGDGTPVTITSGGPLEFCFNDDNLADNTGAWAISLTVDETAVP